MKLHKPFLQTLFLLVLAASAQAQVTIYDNPFIVPGGTGSGNNFSISTTVPTWEIYTTATGTGPHTANSRVFISDRPFKDAPADTYGIVAMDGTGGTGPKFTFTTGLNIDPTSLQDITFNWLEGNAGNVLELHLAVQVGGQWYASNPGYTTAAQSATDFGSLTSTTAEQKSLVYSPTASNWNVINFDPNVTLGMGGAASSDLSGNITGIGFFAPVTGGGTSIIRFADFTVTAVPEPSTTAFAAVGLLGALAFLRARRRRRNA